MRIRVELKLLWNIYYSHDILSTMRDGFIKVAAATPRLKVADVSFNKEKTISLIKRAVEEQVKLLVLPELTLTCYTSADVFFHPLFLHSCLYDIEDIVVVS